MEFVDENQTLEIYFKLIDHTSGEKLPKHIAFSETAIANSIPIKESCTSDTLGILPNL